MSLAKRAIRGGLWMAGIRYIAFIINFGGNLWLARLLVPEDFGVFALAMSMAEILSLIGAFSLAQACIQLQDEPKVFDTGIFYSWSLGAALFVLGLLAAVIVSHVYSMDTAIFMAVFCAMNALQLPGSVYLAHLEKDFAFRRSAIITGLGRSLGIGLGVTMAIAGVGRWSLLWREVIAIGFVFIGSIIFSNYRFKFSYDKETAQKIWRFSCGMFFMRMSEVFFNRVPNFLVGSLAGPSTLGFFERSLYVANLPNTMLSQFYGKVGFAVFSKVKNEPEKIAYGLEWNLFWVSRVVFLAALLIFLYPKCILTMLLGTKWAQGALFFQGLALFIAFIPFYEIIKGGLLARGQTHPVVLSRVLGILAVGTGITLSWVLGGHWIIVAWSMSMGALFGFILLIFSCYRQGIKIGVFNAFKLPGFLALFFLTIDIVFLKNNNVYFNISIITLLWMVLIIYLDLNKIKKIFYYFKN